MDFTKIIRWTVRTGKDMDLITHYSSSTRILPWGSISSSSFFPLTSFSSQLNHVDTDLTASYLV